MGARSLSSCEVGATGALRQREGHPHPERVVHADVLSAPFPSRFDVVTVIGSTLGETGESARAMEACLAMLRPGGLLLSMDVAGGPTAWVPMVDAGREDCRVVECEDHADHDPPFVICVVESRPTAGRPASCPGQLSRPAVYARPYK